MLLLAIDGSISKMRFGSERENENRTNNQMFGLRHFCDLISIIVNLGLGFNKVFNKDLISTYFLTMASSDEGLPWIEIKKIFL